MIEFIIIRKGYMEMERVMTIEDKIRRAEEIYYRRNKDKMPEIKANNKKKVTQKRNIKFLKKAVKQIIGCLIIYAIFYIIINNNYIFSEDFSNKLKEILNQDINLTAIYNSATENMKKLQERINGENVNNSETDNVEEEIEETEQQESQENITNDQNIGGTEATLTEVETQNEVEISQMEQDANYVKNTIGFIKPVEGTVSSAFGVRNPTTPNVPKNHTGTDIAAEIGTKIVSATDGSVILESSTGDYGKHLKIQNNDVVIVYAHCNDLYVHEGDVVTQGQEIAEVGATGNATGPHLHFEVRYQDRYINPQLILEL